MSIALSVLPPPAIEIGFTQARVERNESQAQYSAVIEKSRPSEQTFAINFTSVNISLDGAATPGSDFNATDGIVTVTLLPAESSTTVTYQILEDSIPENEEFFRLVLSPDPVFFCDSGEMSRYVGFECFSSLEVVILDDDGEPLVFLGVANSDCS